MSAAATDPLWTPPETRGPLHPVIVRKERDHAFKKKPARRTGCAHCNKAQTHPDHLGQPPTLSTFTSSRNPHVYHGIKRAWEAVITDLLVDARLPRPLGKVFAEGRVGFPDRNRRDQGNFRFLIEKALGDALTQGGWLADDKWDFYEFGNLSYVYDKGRSWTQLVLLPAWPEEPSQASLLTA